MADLSSLLERVELATEPDRELDADLHGYFYEWAPDCRREWQDAKKERITWWHSPEHSEDDSSQSSFVPAYLTASIDAALALVERVRPGWDYSLDRDGVHYSFTGYTVAEDAIMAVAPTAPLAILAALLRALIAGESQ